MSVAMQRLRDLIDCSNLYGASTFEMDLIILSLVECPKVVTDLVYETDLNRSSITRICKRMEDEGLIDYQEVPNVKNRHFPPKKAALTDKGAEVARRILDALR